MSRGGGGCVPLQVDMHLNGSFLIVCQGLGGMCVGGRGGGGVPLQVDMHLDEVF